MPSIRPLLFLLPACMLAQTNTAELAGVVLDPSGGAIAKVSLTITNVGTGASRSAQSDSQGGYRLLRLLPGRYDLTATADGFRTEKHEGLLLTVGQQATLNLSLAVAAVATEATVVAGTSLVELQNAALSDVIDPKAIRELPLNGRDFAQLALLEPALRHPGARPIPADRGPNSSSTVTGPARSALCSMAATSTTRTTTHQAARRGCFWASTRWKSFG